MERTEKERKLNVCVRAEPKLAEKVKTYADRHGMTLTWIVERALEAWIANEMRHEAVNRIQQLK